MTMDESNVKRDILAVYKGICQGVYNSMLDSDTPVEKAVDACYDAIRKDYPDADADDIMVAIKAVVNVQGDSDSAPPADDKLLPKGLTLKQGTEIATPCKGKGFSRIISASDLKDIEFPPVHFIIDGILPIGMTTLIASPKSGKSWMALDIAECVARGSDFWNRKTECGSVLYLALEDHDRRLQTRLNTLESGFPEKLDFVEDVEGKTINFGLLDAIEEWVNAKQDAKLIIIDVVGLVGDRKRYAPTAYGHDLIMYKPLHEFAHKHNIAILCITHKKKSDGRFAPDDPYEAVSGSMAIIGVADCNMIISGRRFAEQKTLSISGRDAEEGEHTIQFNKITCKWEYIGNKETIANQKIESDYMESPIAKVIKAKLDEFDTYIATPSTIVKDIRESGLYFSGNNVAVGNALSGRGTDEPLTTLLDRFDSIKTEQKRSNQGSYYIFSKVKQ